MGHIMISYNSSNRKEILRIRDNLISHGYSVLMDVDSVGGSIVQSTMEATELANVVLVCISQKYKDSSSCRLEATYAFELNKAIILLLMEENYQPDGWLGVLAEDRKLYDFSGKHPFESQFKDLLREISHIYGKVPAESEDEEQGPAIPLEILRMDSKSLQLYKEALRNGREKVYNIRVMVVGHSGVGKTTLIKRLLGHKVDISKRESTDGIDVYKHCCRIALDSGEWIVQLEDSDQLARLQRLMKLLNNQDEMSEVSGVHEQHRMDNNDEIPAITNVFCCNSFIDMLRNICTRSESNIHQVESHESRKGDNHQEGESHEFRKGDATMEILHLLKKKAQELKKRMVDYAPLSIWDFAGQSAFYTTHQTFLSHRAIYLLVTDMCQQFTDLIRDDEFYFDAEGIKLSEVQELVEVWLNSIHCCTQSLAADTVITSPAAGTQVMFPATDNTLPLPGSGTAVTPPVILVGTHVDQLPKDKRQEVINMYFPQICRILKDKPALLHLVQFVAVDNTKVDHQIKTLKDKIFQLASGQPYWGEEVPASWLPLEEALMKLKAAGIKIIPLSRVQTLNQAASIPIETGEMLDLFLRFQHEIGTILYFSVDGLKENVVLDPQWLIDALKSLITAQTFFLRKYPALRSKWFDFSDNGKLTHELIDAIWTKENFPDFHDNKEHILLLMEKLCIIARPIQCSNDCEEDEEENYFIVPCELRQKIPKEIIFPEPHDQTESSSVLCYVFTEKFLPTPIFHRLLAACVAHWPIAKQKKKNLIFCGCCIFQLGQNHKLTLYFREYVIFVRVDRKGISDKIPSSKLCIEVREFITAMLIKIVGYLGQNLKFEHFIQCPKCNGDNVNGLIPVSKLKENSEVECDFHDDIIESYALLKFWFGDVNKEGSQQQHPVGQKEQSSSVEGGQDDTDTPITEEHINHARLCNALTTVCANALRMVLLSQVPVPNANIYQAIIANKVMLTSGKQGQKPLLNKDQRQLVFPDPKNRFTGSVDEFDISLLYTLIRNVSSVQQPTTRWGSLPTEKPRDTSLGASVERIRLYRNNISGHSVDGKINQQEFEDYWNKINDVLDDIENVIGTHNFKEELEKRKQQVITPHEARELQKIFKDYRKQVDGAAGDIQLAVQTVQTAADAIVSAVAVIQKL